ncbi:hypothetical protein LTR95_010671 [Oleoguttula sp. CCFEE 5521]
MSFTDVRSPFLLARAHIANAHLAKAYTARALISSEHTPRTFASPEHTPRTRLTRTRTASSRLTTTRSANPRRTSSYFRLTRAHSTCPRRTIFAPSPSQSALEYPTPHQITPSSGQNARHQYTPHSSTGTLRIVKPYERALPGLQATGQESGLRIIRPYLQSEREQRTTPCEGSYEGTQDGSEEEVDPVDCHSRHCDDGSHGGGRGGEDCDEFSEQEDLDDRVLEDQCRDEQYRDGENCDDEYCDDEYGEGRSPDSDIEYGDENCTDDEYDDVDLVAPTRNRKRAQEVKRLPARRKARKAKGSRRRLAATSKGKTLKLTKLWIFQHSAFANYDEGSTKALGRNAPYETLFVARKFHRDLLDFWKSPGKKGAEKILPMPTLRRGNLFAVFNTSPVPARYTPPMHNDGVQHLLSRLTNLISKHQDITTRYSPRMPKMTQIVLGQNEFDISMISAMTEYNEETIAKPGIYGCWVVFLDGSVWVCVGSSHSRDRIAARISKAYNRLRAYLKAGPLHNGLAASGFARLVAKKVAAEHATMFVRPLIVFEHAKDEKTAFLPQRNLHFNESIYILIAGLPLR